MAKKASVKDIINALAKERGMEVTDLERVAGGGLKGRLESGAGFSESFKETGKEKIQNIKKTFSKEGAKDFGKQVFKNFFSGDDIFSAYARGRLVKPSKDEKVKPEKGGGLGGSELSKESATYIQILAENTMGIHMMARDVNVMRQNLQELVKLWSGKKDKGPASKADIQFRTEKEDRQRLQSKVEKIRSEDVDYFAEQDKKEAELEASRQKAPGEITPEAKKAEEKPSSFLDTIISLFSSGFMKTIKTFFNPKMLMKVVSKVFLPLVIIGTIFSGIKDGFKKYQETGSFSEAIVSGLGGMLDFLTFGLFGPDTLSNLFSSISDFFDPITSTISGIFTGIKDFFKGLFGGKVDVKDTAPKEAKRVKPSEPSKGGAPSAPGAAPGAAGGAGGAEAPSGAPPGAATAQPAAMPPPPKPTPVPAAAAAPSAAPTKAPPAAAKLTKQQQERNQVLNDVEALEMAQGDLQGLYSDWRDEKGQIKEQLINSRVKFSDDPKAPNYPAELKAVDEKYNKLIGNKKAEIENLKKKPGVKEELKRQKVEDARFDELEKEATMPKKVGGTKFSTTDKVETTGGGETTITIAKTPEAKKAEAQLKTLEKKQEEERNVAVQKAMSEGKIKGLPTFSDFEEIGELKALKTKQEAERAELIKKIDAGTSTQTTTSGGAGSGGAAPAGAMGAAPSAGGGGAVSSGGGAMPSMGGGGAGTGAVSAAGGAPAAASTSPTPSEPSKEQASLKVPSGGDISAASSQVAEEQRMESAADKGSVVNAGTTNNSSGKLNQSPKQKSDDVYNSELVNRLAYS